MDPAFLAVDVEAEIGGPGLAPGNRGIEHGIVGLPLVVADVAEQVPAVAGQFFRPDAHQFGQPPAVVIGAPRAVGAAVQLEDADRRMVGDLLQTLADFPGLRPAAQGLPGQQGDDERGQDAADEHQMGNAPASFLPAGTRLDFQPPVASRQLNVDVVLMERRLAAVVPARILDQCRGARLGDLAQHKGEVVPIGILERASEQPVELDDAERDAPDQAQALVGRARQRMCIDRLADAEEQARTVGMARGKDAGGEGRCIAHAAAKLSRVEGRDRQLAEPARQIEAGFGEDRQQWPLASMFESRFLPLIKDQAVETWRARQRFPGVVREFLLHQPRNGLPEPAAGLNGEGRLADVFGELVAEMAGRELEAAGALFFGQLAEHQAADQRHRQAGEQDHERQPAASLPGCPYRHEAPPFLAMIAFSGLEGAGFPRFPGKSFKSIKFISAVQDALYW